MELDWHGGRSGLAGLVLLDQVEVEEHIDLHAVRAHRLSRVRTQMAARSIDACVLLDPINIRYATGARNMQVFHARNPARYLFVSQSGPVILHEFAGCTHLAEGLETIDEIRPAITASYVAAGDEIARTEAAWAKQVGSLVREHCGARAAAGSNASMRAQRSLSATSGSAYATHKRPSSARAIKSAAELKCVRASIRATEVGVARLREAVRPGLSENELWSILHQAVIALGGDYVETRLLSSGSRTNPWFQEAGERRLREGKLVALDTDVVGCHGYYCDFSRTFHTVPGPKKNAHKVKAQIEGRLALGPLYDEPPELLGDFLAGWLDRYGRRVRPSTLKRRREALRALVALGEEQSDPFGLAAMRLDRITTAAVEDAISVVAERAPRQAQIALSTIKLALKNARDRGQTVEPGLFTIAAPKGEEREPVFLTWKQVLELASWMPEQISRIVPVAALTGAREGELFALRADDVDFTDETLLVVATGSNRRGQTKTRASKRTIDLAPLAAQLLREQLLARSHTSGGLVFPAPQGGIWGRDNFTTRVVRPAVRRAAEKHRVRHGLSAEQPTPFDGLTFHDLRHTCASLMIAAANVAGAGQAVTIKSIAEQLGHTDGGVLVLRRYGHLFKGTRRQAALALDTYVRDSGPSHGEDFARSAEATPRAK